MSAIRAADPSDTVRVVPNAARDWRWASPATPRYEAAHPPAVAGNRSGFGLHVGLGRDVLSKAGWVLVTVNCDWGAALRFNSTISVNVTRCFPGQAFRTSLGFCKHCSAPLRSF